MCAPVTAHPRPVLPKACSSNPFQETFMPSTDLDRRSLVGGLCALALSPLASAEAAFTPGQPIKVLIGVPAGGTQDVLTRAIAQEVRDSLGPLIVDNRSGASGRIAVEAVKIAPPD